MPATQAEFPPDAEAKEAAEQQIVEHHRLVDYNTKEYPVEVIVGKYITGLETEENEFFIPDYQREHTWDVRRQSKFIESVLMGLPIPFLFVADVRDDKGRVEIVDGSQRIRTLSAFSKSELTLTGLEKLPKLNGFKYSDFSLARQRKFNRTTLRLIELTDKADDEVRRDIFERINTGSDPLNHMEQRRGIMRGPFLELVKQCAENERFHRLAPIAAPDVKRREREEFVLRFFAYLDRYATFDRSVKDFLDGYVKDKNDEFLRLSPAEQETQRNKMRAEFESMLGFIEQHAPFGFRKGANHVSTPRIRFEALSVGTALALREQPGLTPATPVADWVTSDEFASLTTSDSSNSRPKVIRRIEYVRNRLLGRPVS